jgi:23S rRNA (cytidine1920-2'-O)/16S rRNA (cytidine1409-2'-O)-methyltransferase
MPGPRPGARARADQLAVDRGLARSRSEAQALLLAGAIHLEGNEGRRLTPGQRLDPGAPLVRDAGPSWASRGAEKLLAALDAFELDVAGAVCLDAGASTGGFTDVLLRRGALRVYAVDVGHGQLLPRLAADERVVVMDRTNLRTLPALPEPIDLATLDLSFISLRLVIGQVRSLLAPDGQIAALVKPQFEAGRPDVPRGGVVRDPAVHRRVLVQLALDAAAAGLEPVGLVASPRTGREGNREFLALLRPVAAADVADGRATERDRTASSWDKLVDQALSGSGAPSPGRRSRITI